MYLAYQVKQRFSTSGGKSVSFSHHPSQNHLKEASVSRNHVDHACFSVRFDLIVSYHLYDLGTLCIWVRLPAGGVLADFITDLIKHV